MRHSFLILSSSALLGGCVLPVPHYTANTLQAAGSVIDAKTKTPIANATVAIRDHPKTRTISDSHGHFETARDISFWPVLYIYPMSSDCLYGGTLVVSASGYLPAEQRVSIMASPINNLPLVTLDQPIQLERK